jgi:hypothetical protein
MGNIEIYLTKQGDISDMQNLNVVADALELSFPNRLAVQLEAMQKAREGCHQTDEPFWRGVARRLIADGELTPAALKPISMAHPVADDRDRPKPLGPRKPLPETTIPTPTQQPGITWPIWILIGVVSVGLLYWACRKSRSPAGN